MDLVDAHGDAARIALGARGQVGLVGPGEWVAAGHHRGGGGAQFGGAAERIGLQRQQLAFGAEDLEFVHHPGAETGGEDFPHAAAVARAHLVAAAVPGVEIADHGHPAGVRRPHREMHALHPLVGDQLGAKPAIEFAVGALGQQIVICGAEYRGEAVGVVELPGAGAVAGLQQVRPAGYVYRQHALKEAVGMAAFQQQHGVATQARDQAFGARHEGADDGAFRKCVQPEQCERVGVPGLHDRGDIRVAGLPDVQGH